MSYRDLYFQLFAAVADALAALQSGQIIQGIQILLRASKAGEDAHLETDILPEQPLEGEWGRKPPDSLYKPFARSFFPCISGSAVL